MKKLIILVVVSLVARAVSSWAQTNAYIISVKGTITQKDGTRIQVNNVSKGISGLVSTDSDVLVLVASEDANAFEVDEVNPATTNIVQGIMATFVAALLDSGQANGDLEANGSGHNGTVTNFPAGIPDFSGDVQATLVFKSGTKKSVNGTLQGVWNDQLSGATNQPPSIFKGSVKSDGTIAVPLNCCAGF
jgi:hypothetical protein